MSANSNSGTGFIRQDRGTNMPGNDGSQHLSEDEVIGFILETLPEETLARVDAHIAICEPCAAELEGYYEHEFDEKQWAHDHADYLARLREAPTGSPAPLVARLWQTLEQVRLPIPAELRPVRDVSGFGVEAIAGESLAAKTLAADRAGNDVAEGTTRDGLVSYSLWSDDEGMHVQVSSTNPELAGERVQVTVDGVPITGTTELAHLELRPSESGVFAAAVLTREHFAARASELGTRVQSWILRLERVPRAGVSMP